ncbi:MAG: tRNA (guanosine(37)-N1)-methyltransferase TrmD [Deltaproteobacteria bacterium]|nr:tRNA (guanosine(37)-N1)-methyltransferase TrmD [Deltaproteobacteria bacterium]
MRFEVLTLFPGLFDSFLRESIMGKALTKGLFEVRLVNVRDYADDRHKTADDRPFGGGPGMVLKPEPLTRVINAVMNGRPCGRSRIILLSPAGTRLTQGKIRELSGYDHLVLVCGRYEGIDERVVETLIDEDISIGDYVLSGGELPAMVVMEAVARFIPGVLGKEESTREETFTNGLLEYPQYTRPRVFEGLEVPETLLSGNHAAIRTWRLKESLRRTLIRRPDLLSKIELTSDQESLLKDILSELNRDQAANEIEMPEAKS